MNHSMKSYFFDMKFIGEEFMLPHSKLPKKIMVVALVSMRE